MGTRDAPVLSDGTNPELAPLPSLRPVLHVPSSAGAYELDPPLPMAGGLWEEPRPVLSVPSLLLDVSRC